MFGFLKPVKIAHLPYCCEVHSHILPGVDDTALRMLMTPPKSSGNFKKTALHMWLLDHTLIPVCSLKTQKPFLQERFKDFVNALPQDIMKFHLAGEYMCDDQMKNRRAFITFSRFVRFDRDVLFLCFSLHQRDHIRVDE